jgi:hypothetical protein
MSDACHLEQLLVGSPRIHKDLGGLLAACHDCGSCLTMRSPPDSTTVRTKGCALQEHYEQRNDNSAPTRLPAGVVMDARSFLVMICLTAATAAVLA